MNFIGIPNTEYGNKKEDKKEDKNYGLRTSIGCHFLNL